MECRITKTKAITKTNQKKGTRHEEPIGTLVKSSKQPKARENAGDQVVIGFSFASDWLRV